MSMIQILHIPTWLNPISQCACLSNPHVVRESPFSQKLKIEYCNYLIKIRQMKSNKENFECQLREFKTNS